MKNKKSTLGDIKLTNESILCALDPLRISKLQRSRARGFSLRRNTNKNVAVGGRLKAPTTNMITAKTDVNIFRSDVSTEGLQAPQG